MAENRIIIFNEIPFYERRKGSRKGYFESSPINGSQQLHRAVWESIYGKLPDGWVIHHLDGDRGNNAIENLKAMPRGVHTNIHRPEFIEKQKNEASKFLKAMHQYQQDNPITKYCQHCGTEFKALNKAAKFCSNKCQHSAYYLVNKKSILARTGAYQQSHLIQYKEYRRNYVLRQALKSTNHQGECD